MSLFDIVRAAFENIRGSSVEHSLIVDTVKAIEGHVGLSSSSSEEEAQSELQAEEVAPEAPSKDSFPSLEEVVGDLIEAAGEVLEGSNSNEEEPDAA